MLSYMRSICLGHPMRCESFITLARCFAGHLRGRFGRREIDALPIVKSVNFREAP
jgi:hypothetical protein